MLSFLFFFFLFFFFFFVGKREIAQSNQPIISLLCWCTFLLRIFATNYDINGCNRMIFGKNDSAAAFRSIQPIRILFDGESQIKSRSLISTIASTCIKRIMSTCCTRNWRKWFIRVQCLIFLNARVFTNGRSNRRYITLTIRYPLLHLIIVRIEK